MTATTKEKTNKKEPKHLKRDEFELEEVAYALMEAMEESSEKVFSMYKRSITGFCHKNGCKYKVNTYQRQIHECS